MTESDVKEKVLDKKTVENKVFDLVMTLLYTELTALTNNKEGRIAPLKIFFGESAKVIYVNELEPFMKWYESMLANVCGINRQRAKVSHSALFAIYEVASMEETDALTLRSVMCCEKSSGNVVPPTLSSR